MLQHWLISLIRKSARAIYEERQRARVTANLELEVEALKARAKTRAQAIQQLCDVSGFPELAPGFINHDLTTGQVITVLISSTEKVQ
jgi:hypothetical protein